MPLMNFPFHFAEVRSPGYIPRGIHFSVRIVQSPGLNFPMTIPASALISLQATRLHKRIFNWSTKAEIFKATVKTEKTADILQHQPRVHSDDMTEGWDITGCVGAISAVFSRKGLSLLCQSKGSRTKCKYSLVVGSSELYKRYRWWDDTRKLS